MDKAEGDETSLAKGGIRGEEALRKLGDGGLVRCGWWGV